MNAGIEFTENYVLRLTAVTFKHQLIYMKQSLASAIHCNVRVNNKNCSSIFLKPPGA